MKQEWYRIGYLFQIRQMLLPVPLYIMADPAESDFEFQMDVIKCYRYIKSYSINQSTYQSINQSISQSIRHDSL